MKSASIVITSAVVLLLALGLRVQAAQPVNQQQIVSQTSDVRYEREGTEWVSTWIPSANVTNLPRVLLVGDSITKGYAPEVTKQLQSSAACAYFTTSASVADPAYALQLQATLDGYQYAVIHFNNGLHGWAYSEAEYKDGYERALKIIRQAQPHAKLILTLTTPLRPDSPKAELNPRVDARNAIVRDLAKQFDAKLDDLHAISAGHGEYYVDPYHYKPEAISLQAAQVAKVVKEAMESAELYEKTNQFVGQWPGLLPDNCPFAPSKELAGIWFTGRHAEYTRADTWYPTWAADGNLYSPWTDGSVGEVKARSYGTNVATTGAAKIIGDDPMSLQVVEAQVYPSDATPYEGRYPCGSLLFNGVWFYGTYCLYPSSSVKTNGMVYNWPCMGPFVGFRYSTDLGRTWTQTPCTPEQPLFGERVTDGSPVRMGSPHFVDFGKNLEHSPDGKAYLVAHGARDGRDRRFGYDSWITGDEIFLARVSPGVANMNDVSKYEFFAGTGWTGKPRWSRKLSEAKPIAAWRDNMGCVTMTYNAPLKKYLMCVTDGGTTRGYFNTYILEADRITGPFKLVQYLHHFGEQGYFVNLPSKFISVDGRKLWLCYSANFARGRNDIKFQSNPPGSGYAMCLQEIRLLPAAQPAAKN